MTRAVRPSLSSAQRGVPLQLSPSLCSWSGIPIRVRDRPLCGHVMSSSTPEIRTEDAAGLTTTEDPKRNDTRERNTAGSQQPAKEMPGSGPRMPLGPLRLLLVRSLCVLAGVLAGRYFAGGPVLATAGATVLATALSYRVENPWFSPLS